MSTIHEFHVDSSSFARLEALDERDLDLFIDGFHGEPMVGTWRAPEVRLTADGTAGNVPAGDFLSLFGSVPILSRRAVDGLGDLLIDRGELLPVRGGDGDGYWAFNVLTTIDLLDEKLSTGDWFDEHRLMTLKRLVPREPVPRTLPPIFKLPQWLSGRAIITQQFIDAASDHDLSALDARPLGEL